MSCDARYVGLLNGNPYQNPVSHVRLSHHSYVIKISMSEKRDILYFTLYSVSLLTYTKRVIEKVI